MDYNSPSLRSRHSYKNLPSPPPYFLVYFQYIIPYLFCYETFRYFPSCKPLSSSQNLRLHLHGLRKLSSQILSQLIYPVLESSLQRRLPSLNPYSSWIYYWVQLSHWHQRVPLTCIRGTWDYDVLGPFFVSVYLSQRYTYVSLTFFFVSHVREGSLTILFFYLTYIRPFLVFFFFFFLGSPFPVLSKIPWWDFLQVWKYYPTILPCILHPSFISLFSFGTLAPRCLCYFLS